MNKAKWLTSYIDVLFILIVLLSLYLSFMDIKISAIIGLHYNQKNFVDNTNLHEIGTPEIRPDAITTSVFQKLENSKKKYNNFLIEPDKEYELPIPLIIFEKGKYTLTVEAKKVLKKASKMLKKLPVCTDILVEGYTDSTPVKGNPLGNWELSLNRALTIANYLKNKEKIPQNNILVIGFANKKPLIKELRKELEIINRHGKIKIRISQECLKKVQKD